MRITQQQLSQNFLTDIGKLGRDLAQFSSQISGGKRLNQLKDSPAGGAALVSLAGLEADTDQYLSNTNASNLYLSIADSALNEVHNLVTTVYTKGSQAASELMSKDARSAFATEIRSLRDQIVFLANSEVGGRYIFAGSKVETAPFVQEGDAVIYRGDDRVNFISIDAGIEVQMSFAGETVFGPLLSAIDDLLTALDGNDTSGIQTALGKIPSAMSDLSAIRAQLGSNLQTLQNSQTRLETRKTNIQAQKSRVEDANLSEAVVRLKQAQNALDAAMSAGGAVLTQRNLFDILG